MQLNVVFSVTLRLLVINISSSSPAINTAAYYQWCVITCETVAVYQRPCLQHLACCSVNTGSQARYRLRIAISAYPLAFDTPVRGFPSEYCYAVWHEKKLEWRGYPIVKKFWCLFILTEFTNVTDTHTDRRTPHDDTGCTCIASRGKKTSADKNIYAKNRYCNLTTVILLTLLSRRLRQRERLHAMGLSICSPKYKNMIFSKTKQFRAMVYIDDL